MGELNLSSKNKTEQFNKFISELRELKNVSNPFKLKKGIGQLNESEIMTDEFAGELAYLFEKKAEISSVESLRKELNEVKEKFVESETALTSSRKENKMLNKKIEELKEENIMLNKKTAKLEEENNRITLLAEDTREADKIDIEKIKMEYEAKHRKTVEYIHLYENQIKESKAEISNLLNIIDRLNAQIMQQRDQHENESIKENKENTETDDKKLIKEDVVQNKSSNKTTIKELKRKKKLLMEEIEKKIPQNRKIKVFYNISADEIKNNIGIK